MSAVAEIQPMFFDEDGGSDLDIQFDPGQFEAVTPYTEDLHDAYQQAQDQLEQLRQQEEQIRKRAEELEELSRKEDSFKAGRVAIVDQIERHLAILDQKATEAQSLAEECGAAHERLEGHLAGIHSLHPDSWNRADRKAELTRALNYIEAAENEVEAILPLVEGGAKKTFFPGKSTGFSAPAVTQGSFLYWLKSGFAFSLPLVGFAIIALLLILVF